MRRSRLLALLVLAPLLLAAAVWLLPSLVLTFAANAWLKSIPGYRAGVARVDVSWRPLALTVTDLRIAKREETAPAVFLTLPSARLEAAPGGLLWARYRLRARLDRPSARFLMRQRRPGQPRKFALWQRFFARLPAFRVADLVIVDGSLRLQNADDIPPLDLSFDRVNGVAVNLANRPGLSRGLPRLAGRARMMGHAPLKLVVAARPFQTRAAFRLKGTLRGFRLATLNPTLRHYTGVDLQGGAVDVAGDLTASRGRFRGRVTRSLRDVQVIRAGESHAGFIPLLKEAAAQAWLNRRKDAGGDIAGAYTLAGPLGYTTADVFLACLWTAKSAFLQSLRPALPPLVRMGTPQRAEEEWLALQAHERAKAAKARLRPLP